MTAVPVRTVAYGCCPMCGAAGQSRERRPNGNDRCANGHVYPSRTAIKIGASSEGHEAAIAITDIEVEACAYVEAYDARPPINLSFKYLVEMLGVIGGLREEMKGMFRPVKKDRVPFVVDDAPEPEYQPGDTPT